MLAFFGIGPYELTILLAIGFVIVGIPIFVGVAAVAVAAIQARTSKEEALDLHACPKCGLGISGRAATCPNCGASVKGG